MNPALHHVIYHPLHHSTTSHIVDSADISIPGIVLAIGTLIILSCTVLSKTRIRLNGRTSRNYPLRYESSDDKFLALIATKHQASINKRKHRNDEFPDYLGDYASSGWPDDSYTGCKPKTDLNTDLYSQYLEIASPDELSTDRMTWGTYRKLHDQNK